MIPCSVILYLVDWMAQDTRVSANLFHENASRDLFLEVDHVPFVVDNFKQCILRACLLQGTKLVPTWWPEWRIHCLKLGANQARNEGETGNRIVSGGIARVALCSLLLRHGPPRCHRNSGQLVGAWSASDTNYFYFAWCDCSRVDGVGAKTRPDSDIKFAKIKP